MSLRPAAESSTGYLRMKSAADDSSYLPMKVASDDYLTNDSSPAYLIPQQSATHDDDDDDDDDDDTPAAASRPTSDTSLAAEKPLLGQTQASQMRNGADYRNVQ